jgi:hypothetical protein
MCAADARPTIGLTGVEPRGVDQRGRSSRLQCLNNTLKNIERIFTGSLPCPHYLRQDENDSERGAIAGGSSTTAIWDTKSEVSSAEIPQRSRRSCRREVLSLQARRRSLTLLALRASPGTRAPASSLHQRVGCSCSSRRLPAPRGVQSLPAW